MDLLSERLAWALKESGQTQTALAAAVGVSKSTVSQWMSDETTNLKMQNLFRAARFLGVEAEWLATGDGPRRLARVNPQADALARAVSLLSPRAQSALRTLIEEFADGS